MSEFNLSKVQKFLLAILFQVVVVFSIIIFHSLVIYQGTEVWLQIMPVDPRDWLRGDYATFQYSISNVGYGVYRDYGVRNGQEVYVVLKKKDKYWVADSVTTYKPYNDETLYIKGKVVSGGYFGSERNAYTQPQNTTLHISYGIEQYYVAEGKGTSLNMMSAKQENYAVVAVDENGNAVLKKIYIDDKPWP